MQICLVQMFPFMCCLRAMLEHNDLDNLFWKFCSKFTYWHNFLPVTKSTKCKTSLDHVSINTSPTRRNKTHDLREKHWPRYSLPRHNNGMCSVCGFDYNPISQCDWTFCINSLLLDIQLLCSLHNIRDVVIQCHLTVMLTL